MNKIHLPYSVLHATRARLRWIFSEFEVVLPCLSGGKDSTVLVNLCLDVAEEMGRLPLPVVFLDQEAEWGSVISYIRKVMQDPRVEPLWVQAPFRLSNAASVDEEWLGCWEEGREWMREKEPDSIHVNDFGTDRFADMFNGIDRWYAKGRSSVQLTGVRCDESPGRFRGLTSFATYKGETWGARHGDRIAMHPLYDWSTSDVWKAIHDHGWDYCRLYDLMYQHGVKLQQMRVSSLVHDTALQNLAYAHELEAGVWAAVTKRLKGVNTARQLGETLTCPRDLPPMFSDWREYRDFLLERMIVDPDHREKMRRQFESLDRRYTDEAQERLCRAGVSMILVNDYHGVKLNNIHATFNRYSKTQGKGSRAERERRAASQ